LAALEHALVQVSVCQDSPTSPSAPRHGARPSPKSCSLGRLLVELGGGGAFGQLVAPDVAGPPREAVPLRIALEIARTTATWWPS
jgi:hypothetical protein